MSEEQLKAFIEKVKADTSLQEKLKAEGADVVAIAKASGFAITKEDLNSDRQNLTGAELEGVAGGHACGGGQSCLSATVRMSDGLGGCGKYCHN
jgi:predicted ribosomally synthesized peptide with nif11-like leader